MPLDPVRVARAMSSGVSAVCALCEHYWEGADRNLGVCTGPKGCGSPLVNDVFSGYTGPLAKESLSHYCFVCGASADMLVVTPRLFRRIGVCTKHAQFVAQNLPAVSEARVVSFAGEVLTPTPPTKPTVWEQIAADSLENS